MRVQVLEQLKVAGQFPSDPTQQARIRAIIAEVGDDVAEALEDGAVEAAHSGALKAEVAAFEAGFPVNRGSRTDLIEKIRASTFKASKRTMDAVTGDVMGVLAQSVEQGLGEAETAALLEDVFKGLNNSNIRTIVRTELTAFENEAAMLRNKELGIGFHQWFTALDDRVRESHESQHNVIVRVGDPFPNGLRFPGDQNGPLGEWISCRCSLIPFVLTGTQMAPAGVAWFFPSDVLAA